MEAKMYSTPRCSWCDRVAKMLEKYEVNVEKIDVSENKTLDENEMQKAAGKKITDCILKLLLMEIL